MKYSFAFCHGWGFDHRFFQPLIKRHFLKIPYYCLNLGYFGKENLYLPEDIRLIGVGHSLGMIKLASLNAKLKALVGIQAFINFLGFKSFLYKRRNLELKAMIKNFRINPLNTLISFRKRCGLHYNLFEDHQLNKEKLTQDLKLLDKIHKLPHIPILILGAANDRIVPQELIYDNFNKNVKVVIHKRGFHNLGFCEYNFVYKQILSFVNGIKKGTNKK